MTDTLSPLRDQAWDLPGLVAVAGSLLTPLGRQGPDERTVRWYQTSGIVARPARYEGRTAMYGYLHLLQVLAVRVWQAEGSSLARIQAALAGQGVDDLERALATTFGSRPAVEAGITVIQLQPGEMLRLGPGAPSVTPAAIVAVPPSLPSPPTAPPSERATQPTGPPAPPGPSAPPGWQVHELQPGVLVLIDPRLVADPPFLLRQLLLRLSSTESP